MRLIAILSLAATALAFTLPRALADEQVTPNTVIMALEGAFGDHPGMRKNHAKGMCATGNFVGLTEA